MKLIPYERHHDSLIRPQPAQEWEVGLGSMMAVPGQAWTAVHDGLPIACGGLILYEPGTAYAWALLDKDAGPHMLALTREIRAVLRDSGFPCIEMAVEVGFEAGRRWARLLGFTFAGLQPGYLYGRDAEIYTWHTQSLT